MADAFASVAVASGGGLAARDWLAKNYPADALAEHFAGDELLEVSSLPLPLSSPLPSGEPHTARRRTRLPRRECAILFTNPQKWRANSALSWYYQPVTVGDTVPSPTPVPERTSEDLSPPAEDLSPPAEDLSPPAEDLSPPPADHHLLRVVSYRDAIEWTAALGVTAGATAGATPSSSRFLVVPLFRQTSRPLDGSRLAVPLQFAADCVSAGHGGVTWCEEHIAVAYFNALQTLAHHIFSIPLEGDGCEAVVSQWITIIAFLLRDFDAYAGELGPVAAVVDHLRASDSAPDMLQYSLSYILSRQPFSRAERLRVLEVSLKRAFKMHETLLDADALRRVVATTVLTPLLYGLHHNIMPHAAVVAHLVRVRRRIFAAAAEWGPEARAADAAAALEREERYRRVAAATKRREPGSSLSRRGSVGSVVSDGGAGGAGAAASSPLGLLQPPTSPSVALVGSVRDSRVAQREAELVGLVMAATGFVLPASKWARLLHFVKDREPVLGGEGDDGSDNSSGEEEDEEEVVVDPISGLPLVKAKSKTKKSKAGSVASSTKSKVWAFTGTKHAPDVGEDGDWRDALVDYPAPPPPAVFPPLASPASALYRPASASDAMHMGRSYGAVTAHGGSARSVASADTNSDDGLYSLAIRRNSVSSNFGSGGRHQPLLQQRGIGGGAAAASAAPVSSWGPSSADVVVGRTGGSFADRFRARSDSNGSDESRTSFRSAPGILGGGGGGGGFSSWRPAAGVSLSSTFSSTRGSAGTTNWRTGAPVVDAPAPLAPAGGLPLSSSAAGRKEADVGNWRTGAPRPPLAPTRPSSAQSSTVLGQPSQLPSALPLPPPTPSAPTKWRLKNLGERADLEELGLVPREKLPFPVKTGGIFRGQLEVTAAAASPAASAPAPSHASTAAAAAAASPSSGSAADDVDAYPFASASPGACAVRIVPEFPSVRAAVAAAQRGAPCPPGFVEMLVLVSLRAPSLEFVHGREGSRAALTLLSVIDRSGSMQGQKLESVKETMAFVIDELGASDELGVVSFDDRPQLHLPITRMSSEGAHVARAAVNGIHSRGGTSIHVGISCALDDFEGLAPPAVPAQQQHLRAPAGRTRRQPAAAAAAAAAPDAVSSVIGCRSRDTSNRVSAMILLSDGQDSCSGFDYAGLLQRASSLRVPVHTFGFGADHDARVLADIAAKTGGNFTYVETTDVVGDAFAAILGGLTSVVTRTSALTLEVPRGAAARGTTIASISSAYESQILENNTSAVVRFGTLYADERREVLVTLRIPIPTGGAADGDGAGAPGAGASGPFDGPASFLTARGSYMDARKDSVQESASAVLALDGDGDVDGAAPASSAASNVDVDIARNRNIVAATLRSVLAHSDGGQLSAASAALSEGILRLCASSSARHPATVALLDDLETIRGRTATSESLDRGGRALVLGAVSSHEAQRFTGGGGGDAGLSSGAAYQVSSQTRMLLTAKMVDAGAAAAGGRSRATRNAGFGRHRSNYDRAMAGEMRIERVPPAGAGGGAAPESLRLRGTLTTAWCAAQVVEEGLYELRVRRFGVRKDGGRPEFLLFGGEQDGSAAALGGDDDDRNSGVGDDGGEEGILAQLASGGTAAGASSMVAVTTAGLPTTLSATGASLVPAVRITQGNVLFGGAVGALLTHDPTAAAPPKAPEASAPGAYRAANTTDLYLPLRDLDAPLRLDVQPFATLLLAALPEEDGDGEGEGVWTVLAVFPRNPDLPVLLGLQNAEATLTRVDLGDKKGST
jgi:hypothetical protein